MSAIYPPALVVGREFESLATVARDAADRKPGFLGGGAPQHPLVGNNAF
jgi:hypothetical protein